MSQLKFVAKRFDLTYVYRLEEQPLRIGKIKWSHLYHRWCITYDMTKTTDEELKQMQEFINTATPPLPRHPIISVRLEGETVARSFEVLRELPYGNDGKLVELLLRDCHGQLYEHYDNVRK